MNIEYKEKYLKYKTKYIDLKKEINMNGGFYTNAFCKNIILLQGVAKALNDLPNTKSLLENILENDIISSSFNVYLNAQYFDDNFVNEKDLIKSFYQNFKYDTNGNIEALTLNDEDIISVEIANILKRKAMKGSQNDRYNPGMYDEAKIYINSLYTNLVPSDEDSRKAFQEKVNNFLKVYDNTKKKAARNYDSKTWKKAVNKTEEKIKNIAYRANFMTGIGYLINSNNRTGKVNGPNEDEEKNSYGWETLENGEKTFTAIENSLKIIKPLYDNDLSYKSDLGRADREPLGDNMNSIIENFITSFDDITTFVTTLADLQGAIQIILMNNGIDVSNPEKLKPYINELYNMATTTDTLDSLLDRFMEKYNIKKNNSINIIIYTDYFSNKKEPDDAVSIYALCKAFSKIKIICDNANIKSQFKKHISVYEATGTTPLVLDDI